MKPFTINFAERPIAERGQSFPQPDDVIKSRRAQLQQPQFRGRSKSTPMHPSLRQGASTLSVEHRNLTCKMTRLASAPQQRKHPVTTAQPQNALLPPTRQFIVQGVKIPPAVASHDFQTDQVLLRPNCSPRALQSVCILAWEPPTGDNGLTGPLVMERRLQNDVRSGDGGSSKLHLAVDLYGGEYAVKEFATSSTMGLRHISTLEQIEREGRFSSLLPQGVPFSRLVDVAGHLHGIMKFQRGRDSFELANGLCDLPHSTVKNGMLALAMVYAESITAELKYLHAMRLMHGELKPENVLWDGDLQFHLADFANVHDLKNEGLYRGGNIHTVGYIAPEYYQMADEAGATTDNMGIDEKFDIYAAGLSILTFCSAIGIINPFIPQKIAPGGSQATARPEATVFEVREEEKRKFAAYDDWRFAFLSKDPNDILHFGEPEANEADSFAVERLMWQQCQSTFSTLDSLCGGLGTILVKHYIVNDPQERATAAESYQAWHTALDADARMVAADLARQVAKRQTVTDALALKSLHEVAASNAIADMVRRPMPVDGSKATRAIG